MSSSGICKSKYGYFTPDGLEYVIIRPDVPKPWINHLSNERYCALISHSGGGYSFVDDSGYNRILREKPGDELIEDRPGRYLYLRDNETGEFWSLGWQPVQSPFDFWEARHGLGYTQICQVNKEIQSSLRFFVPVKGLHEFWTVRLKNLGWKKRNLSIFTYVEWCLGNYQSDLVDRSFDTLFNVTECEEEIIFATKRRWIRPDRQDLPWDKIAFLYSNLGADGFDCSKREFLGPFKYLSAPKIIQEGRCSQSCGQGEDAVGVLMKQFQVEPGEEIIFDICLGVGPSKKEIKKRCRQFSRHEAIESEWESLQLYWQKYLEKIRVKTPDPEFDISVNYWNKYQAWITPHWSEMDSYYISGGATYGFRDECQHLLGILPHDLEFAKSKLIYLLEHQFTDGKVFHNFDVFTNKGAITGHADDCQWLVMSIIDYLNESGDLTILNQKVKYYNGGKDTVFEHLLSALDYTVSNRSSRGLALHRTADWNDALAGGYLGRGESMMVSNQMCWNIIRLLPILEAKNRRDLFKKYKKIYEEIKQALNKYCWDGAWYIRATRDDGEAIGSHRKKEGKIFLDGQIWPVMSGVADEKRGKQAMDSVDKLLNTPYGPCLFLPSYTYLNSALGIISQFSPGTKENGTIFNHPVSWAVISECILGRGEKAYNYWRKTSFMTRGQDPELYKAEPYVYAEFVYGPESKLFGEGSFTWTTGSAAWFFRACLDWILGIRPTLDGLLIDPCIPPGWKKYQVVREFRKARYEIEVRNPEKISKGVNKIQVDGKEIKGKILPDFREGKHLVKVLLGKQKTSG
ncbi:MAG TPA: glycosyl transferase family 36 [Candidatus Bathyarchaeia archaeon]|nr:glycosyl transferase family 36 [Candidatus Bathyarchaeia archaeon]